VARGQGFDALLTISNQIAPAPGGHPTDVDRRKLKSVRLHHLSWTEVLTTAVMQKVHRGVADPDQAWILQELIRYLEHERSGAMEFGDMGPSWTTVRDALTAGTLRPTDGGLLEVVGRFDQLLHYASLRLGKQLGIEVQLVLSRREQGDPRVRAELLADSLVRTGAMSGSLRIPNTVAPVTVTADLRAGRVSTSIDVDAPKSGKPVTRVNWLVRQLKDAPGSLRIDALAQYDRGPGASELLETVRADPNVLVTDAKRELKTFHVSHSCPTGTKRARGRGSFIDSVLACLDGFYESTVQVLKPWSAPPPKLRSEGIVDREPKVAPSLPSTSISSQDGTENGTGLKPQPLASQPPTSQQAESAALLAGPLPER